MTHATYGGEEHQPELREIAESLYVVLALERAFGTLPVDSAVRVFLIDNSRLFVAVGGLGDQFLLGPHANLATSRPHVADQPKVADQHYTGSALRLRRTIEELVDHVLPHEFDGSGWFSAVVWLQPQTWADIAADHPEGVTVIINGEVQ